MRLYEFDLSNIEKIKTACAPWLAQNPHNEHIIYRGLHGMMSEIEQYVIADTPKNRKPLHTHKSYHAALQQSFERLGYGGDRANSIFVTGNRKRANYFGATFIIMPIGEFQFTWSPKITDFTFYQNNRGFTPRAVNLTYDTMKHLLTILSNRIIGQKVYSTLYRLLSNGESPDEVYKKLLELVPQKVINKVKYYTLYIMEHYQQTIDLNPDDVDQFVKDHYITIDLIAAIDSGNEIMINCEKYYAINQTFYKKYIKDQL